MGPIDSDPQSISHYRILRVLGRGGMGAVYLARDTTLLRDVALKVLPRELASDPDRLGRFEQEAKLASALSHPNVAHIYETGESQGLRFISMEYVEGETLKSRFTSGPLPVNQIREVAMDVADALDAAHQKGIIHRDIKPANLILDTRGHAKVLDFGVAKLHPEASPADQTELMTSAGFVVGTIQYMSPEQLQGKTVDHRTDLYSLGLVLREAAGETPLPPELDRIVRKCLESDREHRYQSAHDLLSDLKSLDRTPLTAGRILKVIIVDDEELARLLVREHLTPFQDVQIVAECGNGFEAVKAIAEHKPDLVFLDVQMPKLDGFEVLELIGREILVIFITAYDQYAMQAFDAHAVDYLLKPFSADRFQKAMERARQFLGRPAPMPPPVDLSTAARPPQQFAQRIVVKDGAKVHIIPVDRLDYAEAQDDYVALHSQGKSYLKQQTISSLEASLDPGEFIRIHRSYLVNFQRVARIEPYSKDSRVVVLTDGKQLAVSRAGYERLKALLDERK